jgi:hypothetical protein
MTLSRTDLGFLAVMLVAGLAVGIIQRTHPGLAAFMIPPFAWPLFVSLVFDLASMPLSGRETIVPLRPGVRVGGVIFAAVLVLVVSTAPATL